MSILAVTANVGSIFEDPDKMLKVWIDEFLQEIERLKPLFVAIHCQEVGGKVYEKSMQHVDQFVEQLGRSERIKDYDRSLFVLDENFEDLTKFTALGNIYLLHESLTDAEVWNFKSEQFQKIEGLNVHTKNLQDVQIIQKVRFPDEYYKQTTWTRKGYMRLRWKIGNLNIDFVNVHLFHDASNLTAYEESPSTFSYSRRRALEQILNGFESDNLPDAPLFIFGDFNFRLDLRSVVDILCPPEEDRYSKKKTKEKLVFRDVDNSDEAVLTIEKKVFDYGDHSVFYKNNGEKMRECDREADYFKDRLSECPRNFPPSYPYCEDVAAGTTYMKTRCPAWCDRILLNNAAVPLVKHNSKSTYTYDVIGKDVCMGDHKPVCLHFKLPSGWRDPNNGSNNNNSNPGDS
ncbi:Type I inositol 1,4,5-trisphosphate 5-phosphatase [Trichoplax sp. H2]|nr:Type I inositol 1,4,5-trisphosphate 5-phosphatase [Trichoplax sp. H2]|eukprot:RDD43544.1 Type I inositol 1,4,5-trisphosphate 5-phosphatase [Trichoplax sp. H2]